jgi:hypothetical protein
MQMAWSYELAIYADSIVLCISAVRVEKVKIKDAIPLTQEVPAFHHLWNGHHQLDGRLFIYLLFKTKISYCSHLHIPASPRDNLPPTDHAWAPCLRSSAVWLGAYGSLGMT